MATTIGRYRDKEIDFETFVSLAACEKKSLTPFFHEFENRKITDEQLDIMISLLNGKFRTKLERMNIVNCLARNFRYTVDKEYRKKVLDKLQPHIAILCNITEYYCFQEEEYKLIWDSGAGRKMLKRSQRKLNEYLTMLSFFSKWVEARDLEFGVFMAGKMDKVNVVSILTNEYKDRLNTNQKEILDSHILAFKMRGIDINDSRYY